MRSGETSLVKKRDSLTLSALRLSGLGTSSENTYLLLFE